VTTIPAMKAPRHMSPVVCKFDITSVLVCLSCKAQTECVRVDFSASWQVGADRRSQWKCTIVHTMYHTNQRSLTSQACQQALHATEMTQ